MIRTKTITPLNTFKVNSISQHQLSDLGLIRTKLGQLDIPKEEKDSTTSTISTIKLMEQNKKKKKKSQFAMQEFLQNIKKKILKDKSKNLNNITQNQKLSPTLVQPLTTEEKESQSYWRKFIIKNLQNSSLLTKIDYVDLLTNSLNNSVNLTKLQLKSYRNKIIELPQLQKNMKWRKICYRLSTILQQKIMEKDLQEIKKDERKLKNQKKAKEIQKKTKVKKPEADGSISIRVYPTKQQQALYLKLLKYTVVIYNEILKEIKIYHEEHKEHKKDKDKKDKCKICKGNIMPTIKYIRDKCISNTCEWITRLKKEQSIHLKMFEETCFDFRDNIAVICVNNYNSNLAKGGKFEVKPKDWNISKRNNMSITILAKYWNNKRGWWSKLWNPSMISKDKRGKLPKELNYMSKLIRTGTNKYYINIPTGNNMKKFQSPKEDKTIVIDPGFRTLYTGLDVEENKILEICPEYMKKIMVLIERSRMLQKEIYSKNKYGDFVNNHRKRQKLTKWWKLTLEKIENTKDNIHKHIAKFLCENYNYIIVPKLKLMSSKKIRSNIKDMCKYTRHCGLVDRINMKSKQYTNCHLFEADEHFTSKVCSSCGNINYKLGGSKIFNCSYCSCIMDRDHNSTRNILMKFIFDNSPK